jgi:aromatic ring-opening dioxygenase catalytic subunit (LigB family)
MTSKITHSPAACRELQTFRLSQRGILSQSIAVSPLEFEMAELVASIGVPHTPIYPSQFSKDGPEYTPRTFREVKAHLDAAKPDAIVLIANDHFNTFFMDNFPTFAIGVTETSYGPNDQTKMPHYNFPVHAKLASHLLKFAMNEGFDFSVTQEFGVDHSMLVPLHFLTEEVKTPVVPIWVNAFVKPLPTARRCYALGKMLKSAIAALPQSMRVAVLATGSFSLEIAGPKIDPGTRNSVPDLEWSRHLHRRIKNAEIDQIVAEATPERMWQAGNVGGELLNWIVMLGTVGTDKPRFLADHEEKDGHAYAVWRWN